MANSWFQFRQFRIQQDRCGMKVSTDACLFGAWAPFPVSTQTILDVGTGTGLLALMAAQRFLQTRITALEIDPAAAAQARENVQASPFAARVDVQEANARHWQPPVRFDALLCNPPFFHRSLQSPEASRNTARHTLQFNLEDLLALMDRALTPEGRACILLPAERQAAWQQLLSENGWSVMQTLAVRPKEAKPINRWMTCCSRNPQEAHSEELTIYDSTGAYTPEALRLLAPFYLQGSQAG